MAWICSQFREKVLRRCSCKKHPPVACESGGSAAPVPRVDVSVVPSGPEKVSCSRVEYNAHMSPAFSLTCSEGAASFTHTVPQRVSHGDSMSGSIVGNCRRSADRPLLHSALSGQADTLSVASGNDGVPKRKDNELCRRTQESINTPDSCGDVRTRRTSGSAPSAHPSTGTCHSGALRRVSTGIASAHMVGPPVRVVVATDLSREGAGSDASGEDIATARTPDGRNRQSAGWSADQACAAGAGAVVSGVHPAGVSMPTLAGVSDVFLDHASSHATRCHPTHDTPPPRGACEGRLTGGSSAEGSTNEAAASPGMSRDPLTSISGVLRPAARLGAGIRRAFQRRSASDRQVARRTSAFGSSGSSHVPRCASAGGPHASSAATSSPVMCPPVLTDTSRRDPAGTAADLPASRAALRVASDVGRLSGSTLCSSDQREAANTSCAPFASAPRVDELDASQDLSGNAGLAALLSDILTRSGAANASGAGIVTTAAGSRGQCSSVSVPLAAGVTTVSMSSARDTSHGTDSDAGGLLRSGSTLRRSSRVAGHAVSTSTDGAEVGRPSADGGVRTHRFSESESGSSVRSRTSSDASDTVVAHRVTVSGGLAAYVSHNGGDRRLRRSRVRRSRVQPRPKADVAAAAEDVEPWVWGSPDTAARGMHSATQVTLESRSPPPAAPTVVRTQRRARGEAQSSADPFPTESVGRDADVSPSGTPATLDPQGSFSASMRTLGSAPQSTPASPARDATPHVSSMCSRSLAAVVATVADEHLRRSGVVDGSAPRVGTPLSRVMISGCVAGGEAGPMSREMDGGEALSDHRQPLPSPSPCEEQRQQQQQQQQTVERIPASDLPPPIRTAESLSFHTSSRQVQRGTKPLSKRRPPVETYSDDGGGALEQPPAGLGSQSRALSSSRSATATPAPPVADSQQRERQQTPPGNGRLLQGALSRAEHPPQDGFCAQPSRTLCGTVQRRSRPGAGDLVTASSLSASMRSTHNDDCVTFVYRPSAQPRATDMSLTEDLPLERRSVS
eukprot:TRINITY_DN287_c1_g1_i6.p1 TRINITY_DN287_c1_g1~~TRINITY_DN287_c1_g1_i6.p1  ORF type:complete len:1020 (+),score=94.26 TRINITY_DN287_c1_g1_i6:151-3210(+)